MEPTPEVLPRLAVDPGAQPSQPASAGQIGPLFAWVPGVPSLHSFPVALVPTPPLAFPRHLFTANLSTSAGSGRSSHPPLPLPSSSRHGFLNSLELFLMGKSTFGAPPPARPMLRRLVLGVAGLGTGAAAAAASGAAVASRPAWEPTYECNETPCVFYHSTLGACTCGGIWHICRRLACCSELLACTNDTPRFDDELHPAAAALSLQQNTYRPAPLLTLVFTFNRTSCPPVIFFAKFRSSFEASGLLQESSKIFARLFVPPSAAASKVPRQRKI